MPRDVATRWNSTFDMLVFAVEYQSAIQSLTVHIDCKLTHLQLSEEEWKHAGELKKALGIFKEATLLFSRDDATVTAVIPHMDRLDRALAADTTKLEFSAPLRAALLMGKCTLNRYYSKTDESELYRIAMVMHPAHKLNYFKKLQWEDDWVVAASVMVHDRWTTNYKFNDFGQGVFELSTMENSRLTPASSSSSLFDILYSDDEEEEQGSSFNEDELDRYLKTDVDHHVDDPIKWWIEHKHLYPQLSRMALDYLSAPASSVGVERIFSQGRLVLSHLRNRLEAQTTRALLCLGEWSKMKIVDPKDLKRTGQLPDVEDEEELLEGWENTSSSTH